MKKQIILLISIIGITASMIFVTINSYKLNFIVNH